MRRLTAWLALMASVLVGYALAVTVIAPAPLDPSQTPEPRPFTTTTGDDLPTTTTTPPGQGTGPPTVTYLVWSTGGLPSELRDGLIENFDKVSVVKGDVAELDAEGGARIPLDALALDPGSHTPFDPSGSLAELRPGTVVLGSSSAELRQVGIGEVLVIESRPFEVVGIAPDEAIGAAEIVFAAFDPDSPVSTDRFALISTDAPRVEVETVIRSLYHGPAPLRIRAEGETPWLRHGDAVLPQVFIKQALGEFSYSQRTVAGFVQSQGFIDDQIIDASVPILGEITCHRVVVEMVNGAMEQLVDEGLSQMVDPSGYSGCWNPRFIESAAGVPSGVSRHAWGAAVDLNARSNPLGSAGSQDMRLVDIMIGWGFTWGGEWLVPDPMHFEYAVSPG